MRDSAVVGAPFGESNAERVQAVLVLDPASKADDVVRQANARLIDHQKIRAAVVWPEAELPRTEGTRKLKRRELRAVADGRRLESRHASKTIGTGGRRDVTGDSQPLCTRQEPHVVHDASTNSGSARWSAWSS